MRSLRLVYLLWNNAKTEFRYVRISLVRASTNRSKLWIFRYRSWCFFLVLVVRFTFVTTSEMWWRKKRAIIIIYLWCAECDLSTVHCERISAVECAHKIKYWSVNSTRNSTKSHTHTHTHSIWKRLIATTALLLLLCKLFCFISASQRANERE